MKDKLNIYISEKKLSLPLGLTLKVSRVIDLTTAFYIFYLNAVRNSCYPKINVVWITILLLL